VQGRVCVGETGCGCQVDRSHHRKVLDVGSELGWRGECGRVSERASRVRRLGTREQCCLVSWDESVWHGDARSGRLRRGNAIVTWHRRRARGGDACYCDCCDCSMGDGVSFHDGDDALLMSHLHDRPLWLLEQAC
jgi:hypothetical protein